MIRFKITPLQLDHFRGTTQGHFTFSVNGKDISTSDFKNNQSMMLVPSITNLMDLISAFHSNRIEKVEFKGIGSSATIEIKKSNNTYVGIKIFREVECEMSMAELIDLFHDGISDFLNSRMPLLSDADPFKSDLIDALVEFNKLK